MNRTRLKLPCLALPLLVLASATLAGCAQIDPYTREGVWKPTDSNERNLAAMVADPTELWWGRERTTGTVRTGTRAVERLFQGAPTPGGGDRLRPAVGGASQGGSQEATR